MDEISLQKSMLYSQNSSYYNNNNISRNQIDEAELSSNQTSEDERSIEDLAYGDYESVSASNNKKGSISNDSD